MGNRGCLHNEHQQIVRQFKLKAWIYCSLTYKDFYRPVMSPGKYTELFFLDAATALAAGHRPCGFCKRQEYRSFKAAWQQGNSRDDWSLKQIDAYMHQECTEQQNFPQLQLLSKLPEGVMVCSDDCYFLKSSNQLRPWSFAGYGNPRLIRPREKARLVTPQSIVNAMRAGFEINDSNALQD